MNRFSLFFNILSVAVLLTVNVPNALCDDIPTDTVQTSAEKPADVKPAGEAKPEEKPADTKLADEAKPEEKPADVKPADEAKPEKKSAEMQSGEEPLPLTPFHKTAWFTLLITIILISGCYYVGVVLAKQALLPDHQTKIAIVLLSFFGSIAALGLGWNRITLGIDLSGGVVLIYDAKPAANRTVQTPDGQNPGASGGIDMDQLTRAITKRINPGGVREIAIAKLGTRQIQVVIPHAEAAEVERIERVISESGALTFRIMASRVYPQDADIIRRAESESGTDILDSAGRLLARWVPIAETEKDKVAANQEHLFRTRGNTTEALMLFNDGVNITGEYLTHVGRGMDENGDPGVSFNFNAIGENKFARLTSDNRPDEVQGRYRHLGVVLNGSLYSAPRIKSIIRHSGIVSMPPGNTEEGRAKTNQEINELIAVLDAGALPAELSKEPVGRLLVGATLGNDTIQKAKYALVFAAAVTVLFMIVYYRAAGFIASFCVITNTMLIVAIMIAVKAAFTLPGLAGLVLTIGMAVDANILIYERIREELAGGSSLKMAIRNGYAKAFSAIFDSNITTMLTGFILYTVGTEQVRGFAVTLILGIGLNMFTAIYCARVIMEYLAQQRWCRTFTMMQFFKRPNINFLAARNVCVAVSAALITLGLIAVIARGRTLLDIDFVGGVSVEAVFKDSQKDNEVRSKLYAHDKLILEEEYRLNDLAVQNVQLNVDDDGNRVKPDTHFIVTTSIPQVPGKEVLPDEYLNTVRGILKTTFGNALEYCKFDYKIETSQKVNNYDETVVSIQRFPKINHDAVKSELAAAVKQAVENGTIGSTLAAPDITQITRADFKPGSQTAFEDWTVVFRASEENIEKVLSAFKKRMDETPNFPTSTTVGGSVARDTRVQGAAAIIASFVLIGVYIWVRFHRLTYGVVAVIGLVHDVLVVLGLLAISRWAVVWIPIAELQIEEFKIGLPVVAAFLTVVGYSINDTIILFDRIRENLGKSTQLTGSMINLAINQTLSRTVLTAGTTFLTSVILYFFGGSGIHTFAFAISAGVFFGTYSTIAICSALLYWCIGVNDLDKKELNQIVREK